MKILNDTQTTHWITGNAGSNEHMIRINEILGHKEWVRSMEFEFNKEALQKQLEI